MTPPKRVRPASHYLRGVMVALALLLPMLSLAVLGTLWLWQNNALLIWSVVASGVALLIYGAEYWLVRRRESDLETAAATSIASAAGATNDLSPREQAASAAIEELARDIDPDTLNNREAVLELGARTVEAVARQMNPDEKDPLWKFTVPEALALVEQVSSKLNRFVVDAVPLGDRLTVGQVLTVYRWRSLATVAEKAYDLWRILRFVNPATAIAGELREKVSGHLMEGMRTEFTRRLARAYVREVGQAAIDLYSGRLRSDLRSADEIAPPNDATIDEAAPLQVLIIGQAGVGKSSLINALSEEVRAAADIVPGDDQFTTYALSRDDVALTYLTDSPSLNDAEKRRTKIIARAEAADAIVWLVSATRPDRAADVDTLRLLRERFASRPDRRPPPIVFLLSNVDRVRPFNEWQPPYDLTDTTQAKGRSIREALTAVADDLKLSDGDIIPVAMATDNAAYNIELVWARLMDVFDDARNVRLLRHLSEGTRSSITSSLWRQAVGAGRVIRSIATKR